MGKSTISMAIFNSYFDITRGYFSFRFLSIPAFQILRDFTDLPFADFFTDRQVREDNEPPIPNVVVANAQLLECGHSENVASDIYCIRS